ncbi:MAG: hypothetical protein WA364_26375 [Candidatus Nitrosopolaris sp.]
MSLLSYRSRTARDNPTVTTDSYNKTTTPFAMMAVSSRKISKMPSVTLAALPSNRRSGV